MYGARAAEMRLQKKRRVLFPELGDGGAAQLSASQAVPLPGEWPLVSSSEAPYANGPAQPDGWTGPPLPSLQGRPFCAGASGRLGPFNFAQEQQAGAAQPWGDPNSEPDLASLFGLQLPLPSGLPRMMDYADLALPQHAKALLSSLPLHDVPMDPPTANMVANAVQAMLVRASRQGEANVQAVVPTEQRPLAPLAQPPVEVGAQMTMPVQTAAQIVAPMTARSTEERPVSVPQTPMRVDPLPEVVTPVKPQEVVVEDLGDRSSFEKELMMDDQWRAAATEIELQEQEDKRRFLDWSFERLLYRPCRSLLEALRVEEEAQALEEEEAEDKEEELEADDLTPGQRGAGA